MYGQNWDMFLQSLRAIPNPSDLVPARHLAYCGLLARKPSLDFSSVVMHIRLLIGFLVLCQLALE